MPFVVVDGFAAVGIRHIERVTVDPTAYSPTWSSYCPLHPAERLHRPVGESRGLDAEVCMGVFRSVVYGPNAQNERDEVVEPDQKAV